MIASAGPGWLAAALLAALSACTPAPSEVPASGPEAAGTAPRVALDPAERRSGYVFLTEESQRLQDDAFENPGYLWVETGAALFAEPPGTGRPACAGCHGEAGQSLEGVAARYPAWDSRSASVFNLERRINACRERYQSLAPLAYESEPLLSLTAHVASLSRGVPLDVTVTPEMQAAWQAGEAYFHRRKGQLNLACSQCHTERWGQKLRGDTISQGHGNGFPAYRLVWQTLGSLHRRFRDCDIGVRAEPYPLGSDTYVALELYLATRAEGLAVESPAIRR